MESVDLAQTAIAILEGSGDITDVIGNPFTSSEGFLTSIFQNSVRFWSALIVFFLRIVALIRVIKDSNARSRSALFQILSALIVILLGPIFGVLLYIAIRPQGRKWDKTPRRDTTYHQVHSCENCGSLNDISHPYCVYCGESLQTSCRECHKKYSKSYGYCPFCGAPNLAQ